MNCTQSIVAASKGKAPIVAIPVEGHAPACVNRKRLATWSKGVTITSAEVVQEPSTTHFETVMMHSRWCEATQRRRDVEGPRERTEVTVPGSRYLLVAGRAGNVKTRAKFALIDRRTAVKELGVWTARERAKHEKKILLGVLSRDEQRALKLAKLGDAGADMVSVFVTLGEGQTRVKTMGAPVKLAALAEYEFVAHRAINAQGEPGDTWRVTERISGMAAGSGTTAQDAIASARKASSTASPASLAGIRAKIESMRPSVAA
jgi:hypothetical protein